MFDAEGIVLEETASKGRYVYRSGGDLAELTFSKAGTGLVIIDHTAVPPAFRGLGVGQALVARAVADFRAAGKKVLPLCPFAAAQFRRHAEMGRRAAGEERAGMSWNPTLDPTCPAGDAVDARRQAAQSSGDGRLCGSLCRRTAKSAPKFGKLAGSCCQDAHRFGTCEFPLP